MNVMAFPYRVPTDRENGETGSKGLDKKLLFVG